LGYIGFQNVRFDLSCVISQNEQLKSFYREFCDFPALTYVKKKKNEKKEKKKFFRALYIYNIPMSLRNKCQFYNLRVSRAFTIERTIVHHKESRVYIIAIKMKNQRILMILDTQFWMW